MSYKTILVNLGEAYQPRSLLHAAAAIAEREKSYVIGLYVMPPSEVRFSNAVEAVLVDFGEDQTQFRQKISGARQAFEKIILEAGIEGEFRTIDALERKVAPILVEHARQSDLLVIEQSNSPARRSFSEEIVVSAGRPTLLIPLDSKAVPIAERVLVGWNGSRESARAIFDGIPLLRAAKEVLVLQVTPESARSAHHESSGIDLTKTLARHGINLRPHDIRSSQEAGLALLEHAEGWGAGLLVMGAYGHPRYREFILGGATRTVLEKTTIPVLFSH